MGLFYFAGTEDGLLPGVEEAVGAMFSGEVARVWIKPGKWSFGSAGNPEFNIPGDASINYEIELKSFTKVSCSFYFAVSVMGIGFLVNISATAMTAVSIIVAILFTEQSSFLKSQKSDCTVVQITLLEFTAL